jgi:hypothetical protein
MPRGGSAAIPDTEQDSRAHGSIDFDEVLDVERVLEVDGRTHRGGQNVLVDRVGLFSRLNLFSGCLQRAIGQTDRDGSEYRCKLTYNDARTPLMLLGGSMLLLSGMFGVFVFFGRSLFGMLASALLIMLAVGSLVG